MTSRPKSKDFVVGFFAIDEQLGKSGGIDCFDIFDLWHLIYMLHVNVWNTSVHLGHFGGKCKQLFQHHGFSGYMAPYSTGRHSSCSCSLRDALPR